MYYKVENKECKVYKELHQLRTKELQIQEDNEKAIEEKIGLKFKTFLGDNGQQNFRRVRQYTGFKFTTPDKVDLKIWKTDAEYKEIFVPNRKTKLGREMAEFLLNGLKGSRYDKVWEILKLEHLRKFTFPYVEIVGEVILIYLSDSQEPKDKNVIEITKREFNELQGRS
jgi:hypothetical protein